MYVQGSQPGRIQNLSFEDTVLQVVFQRRETICAQIAYSFIAMLASSKSLADKA